MVFFLPGGGFFVFGLLRGLVVAFVFVLCVTSTLLNREHKEKEQKEAEAKTQEEARPETARETQTTKTNV